MIMKNILIKAGVKRATEETYAKVATKIIPELRKTHAQNVLMMKLITSKYLAILFY